MLELYSKSLIDKIDEYCRNNPPQIKLYGWWWKRFIPKYRRIRKNMQSLIDYDWKKNGYNQFNIEMNKIIDDFLTPPTK